MQLPQTMWLLLLLGAALLCSSEARRIRVRPLPQEEQEEETIQYYAAAEPREDTEQRFVYVAADQYNGLYGQPTASPRIAQEYVQPSRGLKAQRVKEPPKAPPVQTIRNYNKVNDDGSFTFGYEAADGSFKEETRGTDCVVRGKYGYVDPDGNKREFTYVSGNPCDPNAPKEEEQQEEEESNEPENVPANYPTKPIRPLARPLPVSPSPKPVTVFQNIYQQQDEDIQPEPEQLLKPQPVSTPRPQYFSRPQYLHQPLSQEVPQSYQRPRLLSPTTPASVIYKQSATPVNITPRPVTVAPTRTELPATTYRPQLLQVGVTPRPSLLYTKQISVTPRPGVLSSTASPVPLSVTRGGLDFESEFQRFQQDNSLTPSPTPITIPRTTPTVTKAPAPTPTGQVYSSELVYDPATGLYNTQLYQTLPQGAADINLSHRIQPYVHQPQHVHQPQPQLVNYQQLQQQSPLYRALRPQPSQAVYQQQQAELQFQNSAQLYAQQQKARAQQPSRPQAQPQAQQPQQQYYYIQPSQLQQAQGQYGGGHIDAFLRGQNIQF